MSIPKCTNRPSETASSGALAELALDLRWSFNHAADKFWEQLDPELWDLTHNPWVVLQTVLREKLQSIAAAPGSQKLLDDLRRERIHGHRSDGRFRQTEIQKFCAALRQHDIAWLQIAMGEVYRSHVGN